MVIKLHSALRKFYEAQMATATAQHEADVAKLSPTNQLLQRCLDKWIEDRWEGIQQANTDAIINGIGVYRDTFTGTEYVILADFYNDRATQSRKDEE